ncbi:MAG: hypothetical protein V4615_06830 [Bacteroidota bacterium]
MKIILHAALILFLTAAACNKKCGSFSGTWQNENYNAYVTIKQNGDIFLISIKDKSKKDDWLTKTQYVMYFDQGLLRSETEAFKTITINHETNTIRINGEKDEWERIPNKSEI